MEHTNHSNYLRFKPRIAQFLSSEKKNQRYCEDKRHQKTIFKVLFFISLKMLWEGSYGTFLHKSVPYLSIYLSTHLSIYLSIYNLPDPVYMEERIHKDLL